MEYRFFPCLLINPLFLTHPRLVQLHPGPLVTHEYLPVIARITSLFMPCLILSRTTPRLVIVFLSPLR